MEQLFLTESMHHLNTYMQRIETACAALSEAEIWWRPHQRALSIGTTLLHLNGNITQWVISGLYGQPDNRNRAAEFDNSLQPEKLFLLEQLKQTIGKANTVIINLNEAKLMSAYSIQGFETTGLQATYHVVEHLSWHCAQITYISKLLQGESFNFSFYNTEALNNSKNK
ncbi:MAG: DUF1572 family protein [Bacteroidia bacterium]|nr:DUF1572 family protein [Bacteroidia bacterium]HQV01667.1 DinB family protein [Bacteroidia bacterium]